MRCFRVVKKWGVLFVRDLARPDSIEELNRLVETYAGNATPRQQQLFRDSLHAALTPEEVSRWGEQHTMRPNVVVMTSDRHWTFTYINRSLGPHGIII